MKRQLAGKKGVEEGVSVVVALQRKKRRKKIDGRESLAMGTNGSGRAQDLAKKKVAQQQTVRRFDWCSAAQRR